LPGLILPHGRYPHVGGNALGNAVTLAPHCCLSLHTHQSTLAIHIMTYCFKYSLNVQPPECSNSPKNGLVVAVTDAYPFWQVRSRRLYPENASGIVPVESKETSDDHEETIGAGPFASLVPA